jgi:triosephosphate isomerase
MAEEIGVKAALVGHSERRQYFGETDATVRKRAESLLKQGFDVMVCIGESKAQRENKETREVILRQLKLIQPLVENAHAKLSIAYEPVWAIGTGLTAHPVQIQEVHALIREQTSSITPILYGGSVTPQNIDSLLACSEVDGALVGGASLKPDSFAALIEAARKILV